MATQITVNKFDFPVEPSGSSVFTLEYKLFSDPGWTLQNSSVFVNTDGSLAVPEVISGLTEGQLYYLRASNNCDSPADYFYQQVQT